MSSFTRQTTQGDRLSYSLEKLDPSVRRNVFSDIEKLYRAIYQIRDEALLVLVVRVGDRNDVYRPCSIGFSLSPLALWENNSL
jgi:hypothetical protein